MRHVATVASIVLVLLASPYQMWAKEGAGKDPRADNAALAYWQAFASLPNPDKKTGRALTKAVNESGPITDKLIEVCKSAGTALDELYRGNRYSRCVWGTAIDDGPNALLSHLSKARELARYACLRARIRFERDRASDAVDDLNAALELGRNAGSDGLIISLLVQYQIESLVFNIAARELPTLEKDALAKLAQQVNALPTSKTMSAAVHLEKEWVLEWFIQRFAEPGGKDVLRSLVHGENSDVDALLKLSDLELHETAVQLRPIYDRLQQMMKLPPDELKAAVDEWSESPEWQGNRRHLGGLLLSAVVANRRTEAVHQTRCKLFELAIAVVQDGRTALRRDELQDPFGDGPFEYTALDDGFRLQSSLVDRDGKPVTFVVGPSAEN